jgi:hypothetical protein
MVSQSKQQIQVIWKPNPGKQTFALSRPEFEILYGGARAGGKTESGIAWLTRWIGDPNLRALVIRKNSVDLKDWIDRANQLYSGFGGKLKGNPGEFHFPSGAIIYTGHLADESAYTKYQGQQYQKIIIEELTNIASEELYEK